MNRRGGMGDFDRVNDWQWMFNPPPYDFLDTSRQVVPNRNFYAPAGSMGLGCGATCSCNKAALGGGLGLFDGGMDAWGWPEYLALAAGLYLAASFVGDSRKVVRRGRKVRAALR